MWFLQKIIDFILNILLRIVKKRFKLDEQQGIVAAIEYIKELNERVNILREVPEKLMRSIEELQSRIIILKQEKASLEQEIAPLRQERNTLKIENEAFVQEHIRHDKALKEKIQELENLLG